jgi:hypothetical protein
MARQTWRYSPECGGRLYEVTGFMDIKTLGRLRSGQLVPYRNEIRIIGCETFEGGGGI